MIKFVGHVQFLTAIFECQFCRWQCGTILDFQPSLIFAGKARSTSGAGVFHMGTSPFSLNTNNRLGSEGLLGSNSPAFLS